MEKNVYGQNLKLPFSCLAPMEDVTDTVFRQVLLKLGKPNLFFTEFTSVEGMFSAGSVEVTQRLKYSEIEKPLIAQIWGKTPKLYFEGAKEIVKMGFNGVDINMGCAVPKIYKQGACSALIKNPQLATEVYLATKEGAGDLPVSIKTRIGFAKIQTEEWIAHLLSLKPYMLTVHVRTVMDRSSVPARWDEMKKVVKLRNEISPETILVGNGDIDTVEKGIELAKKYGFEGYMIGRGVFKNPWVFSDVKFEDITYEMRIEALKMHLNLFKKVWGETKNYSILKKFFKIYISNFDGAGELRNSLMNTNSVDEALGIC